MQIVRRILAIALTLWLAAPQVNAQVLSTSQTAQSAIDQALAQRASAVDADRQAVRRVLNRAEVRDVVDRMGVDIERLQSAVGVLDAEQLAQAASHARAIDQNLAGGATTVTITATTVIIILLVVILIVLIVD